MGRGHSHDRWRPCLPHVVTYPTSNDSWGEPTHSLSRRGPAYPTIAKSWVDSGFKKAVVEHGAKRGIDVGVVNRNPGVRGFHVVKGAG